MQSNVMALSFHRQMKSWDQESGPNLVNMVSGAIKDKGFLLLKKTATKTERWDRGIFELFF